MNKRVLLCGLTLLMAAASFSCGKTETKTEPQTEITSETTIEDSTETTTKKKKSSSGFGMMGYVNKSQQSVANCNAKILHNAFTTYLLDNQLMADTDMIYSNTAVCDMSKEIKEYTNDEKDYDFIIIFNDKHMPETVLVPYYDKDNHVGSYVISDEYDGMKWSEALEKYGFKAGGYTDIPLVESDDAEESTLYKSIHDDDTDDSDDSNREKAKIVASRIANAAVMYFIENQTYPAADIFYGHTDLGEYSEYITENAEIEDDTEFIIKYSQTEYVDTVIVRYNMESSVCGVYGRDAGNGQISWEEALEKYGLKQGEYTEEDVARSASNS